MEIHLDKLKYTFTKKPLLVGGMAMEYYGLRKSGKDIDLMAPEEDVINLIKMYPDRVKNLCEDLGVCPFEFEIWKTIGFLNYNYLKEAAIEEKDFLVILLEKLLLMKALGMDKEKYLNDTKLIVKEIINRKYKEFDEFKRKNEKLLSGIANISYIERRGPSK